MVITGRAPIFLALLCALAALVLAGASVSGASLVARDGKIHACYKAKGKGKGTLRVVRNTKVKCPKRWKKTAWYAAGRPGPQGEQGPQGQSGAMGATGATGAQGAPGRNENVVVNELEDKVTELLTRVKQLEALVPVVGALCTQAGTLTGQVNSVEKALGGLKLNAVLTTLGGVLSIPTLPGALPAFSCPS